MAKVSVIIPVYNVEKYIDRCIESVLQQTEHDIEILLMIGMCEDHSFEKCIAWQKKDARIVIVRRKDTSLGDARNYGLKMAKGIYIVYVDADDWVDPCYVEKLTEPLEEDTSIDVSCCGFIKYGKNELILPRWKGKRECTEFRDYIKDIGYGVVWLRAYRRKWLFEKNMWMFDGCHEDDAMSIMMSGCVKNVYYIKETLYFYNTENEGSLFHDDKKRCDYCRALSYAIEYLKKENLYDSNRIAIRQYCVSGITNILKNLNEKEEFEKLAFDFYRKYFPEVAEEIQFRKCHMQSLKEELVLFGAGSDGRKFLNRYPKIKISYIADNNSALWQTSIGEHKIQAPQKMVDDNDNITVLIASNRYYWDIAKQLREMQIKNYGDAEEILIKKMLSAKKKLFLIMNTPEHSNIGDHVITQQEKMFVEKYLPEYQCVEFSGTQYRKHRELIRKCMPQDAIIAISGGGFLGSLWYEDGEKVTLEILSDYANHEIIVFPQTMYYEDCNQGKAWYRDAQKTYLQCGNIVVLLREEKSYHKALEITAGKVECHLMPDIALSLQGYDSGIHRNTSKAAICLKIDHESILTEKEKKKIQKIVGQQYQQIEQISMFDTEQVTPMNRAERIKWKIEELKQYSLVVTDALHCMILCAVSGTPCVVFNSISRKQEGVYQWIRHLPYVKLVENVDGLESSIESVCACTGQQRSYVFDYEPYFEQMKNCILERNKKNGEDKESN